MIVRHHNGRGRWQEFKLHLVKIAGAGWCGCESEAITPYFGAAKAIIRCARRLCCAPGQAGKGDGHLLPAAEVVDKGAFEAFGAVGTLIEPDIVD